MHIYTKYRWPIGLVGPARVEPIVGQINLVEPRHDTNKWWGVSCSPVDRGGRSPSIEWEPK
jgi:hypothetical protein